MEELMDRPVCGAFLINCGHLNTMMGSQLGMVPAGKKS
jgi:hypothetical protein